MERIEVEKNVYETTDLRLELPEEFFARQPEIQVEELFGSAALLLRNVLSKEECEYVISQAEEMGLKSVSLIGYNDRYRNNDRVMAMSQPMASLLFKRISSFLEPELVISSPNHPTFHLGTQGRWKLSTMNDCFRLCRYQPGGHFSPHYDGEFVRTGSERSFKTVMLYLNDTFEGGTTNFINDSQTLFWDESLGRYRSEEKNIILKVKPEPGMAIVFNHKMLHEGAAVEGGIKYIMRTEAMYSLQDRMMSEEEERFHLLIQQAQELEAQGKVFEAVKAYQTASKLSPELATIWGI